MIIEINTLSLDQQVTYELIVPGVITKEWLGWLDEIDITVTMNDNGMQVSQLIGIFDQAALHGLLRRLYSLGIPLQSVRWIQKNQAAKPVD
jgi:hypothetical protein